MKILITGANGFIGRNLIDALTKKSKDYIIYKYDINNTMDELKEFTKDCDFVYNFAAVHRPKDVCEFEKVNHLFFDDLLAMLKEHNNKCPVLYTSSIQAGNGSEYGNSKISAEQDLIKYGEETKSRAIVYRLTNTFGRWATPNHHSVVATFCYNLNNGLEISVSDPTHIMNFSYVDDVIDSFIMQLDNKVKPDDDGIYRIAQDKLYSVSLGKLADLVKYFQKCQNENQKVVLNNSFEERLYYTYCSYAVK